MPTGTDRYRPVLMSLWRDRATDLAGSDRDDVEPVVDAPEVVRARRDDSHAALSCGERDCGVGDVVRAARAAQLTNGASGEIVEWSNLAHWRTQQPSHADLGSTIAPRLRNYPSGHDERVTVLKRAGDDGNDSSVIAVERDERAGVKHCAAQRPSATDVPIGGSGS